jgi:5-formyltetrahydrofolate cyclo-ligase
MDHASLKKVLRKQIKADRAAMTPEEVATKSKAIYERWRNRFSLKRIGFFHVFQSMQDRSEVDTRELTQFVWERHPQVHLVVPVVDYINKRLRHALVHDTATMVKDRFGIPQPPLPVDFVHPVQIDMVMVPLLAYDLQGNRLGYGAGHYDQFLALTRPACIKIGLCFQSGQLPEPLPVEAHDVPLDFVVTENTIIRFNPNFQI